MPKITDLSCCILRDAAFFGAISICGSDKSREKQSFGNISLLIAGNFLNLPESLHVALDKRVFLW